MRTIYGIEGDANEPFSNGLEGVVTYFVKPDGTKHTKFTNSLEGV
ncbi:hypothetical protein [Faecalicoccus pleomorphus]|nr:hypothetical protein [Faecalicoccus pleomorphus]